MMRKTLACLTFASLAVTELVSATGESSDSSFSSSYPSYSSSYSLSSAGYGNSSSSGGSSSSSSSSISYNSNSHSGSGYTTTTTASPLPLSSSSSSSRPFSASSSATGSSSDSSNSSNSTNSSSGSGATEKSHSALVSFLAFLFNVGLVFGPHIGYLFQYLNIRETFNIEGYSLIVSVILLVSNTIRIFYYPGSFFALALLFQALVAIAVHCLLLHQVLVVHHVQTRAETEGRVLDYLSGISSYDVAAASNSSSRGRGNGNQRNPAAALSSADAGGMGTARGDTGKKTAAGWMEAGAEPAPGAGDATSYNIDINAAAASAAAGGGGGATDSPTNLSDLSEPGANPVEVYGYCLGGLMNILNAICDAVETRFKRLLPAEFIFDYGVAAAVGFFSVLILFAVTGFSSVLVNLVGYLALGIEATLVIPQILRNARRRSTEGLTVVLIITWVGGDIVKIIYFFVASQPLPFILCGFFQLSLDFVVVYQYFAYRAPHAVVDAIFPDGMV